MSGGMERMEERSIRKIQATQFEDFIIEKHAEQYSGLDDYMADDYDRWVEELEPDDWPWYGSCFARLQVNKAISKLGGM